MKVNAYGEHVGGGPRPWQLDVVERMAESGKLRYCDVCGRPFRPRNERNVYCSFRCKQEANRYRARMRNRKLRAEERARRAEVLGR